MEVIAVLFIFVALAMVYFIPAIVAGARGHHNMAPIVVINFFLGWTLLGWVAALAMAVSPVRVKEA